MVGRVELEIFLILQLIWLLEIAMLIKILQKREAFKIALNPLSAIVAVIEKPVNWFAQQIDWLVSVWRQDWHLMGWS